MMTPGYDGAASGPKPRRPFGAPNPAREQPRVPSLPYAASLVHWLVLISGLALLTVVRIDEPQKIAPLWVGAVVGTGLGQILAHRRMRLWLFAFIVGNLMWLGPLTVAPLWALLGAHPWSAMETFVMAFVPAAVCGYLSLSERGALLAFWFPAVPWMAAILERSTGLSLQGEESWLLLGLLGVLLLGLLRARESRRVALWQGYAPTRLAKPGNQAVLREAPLRRAGQLGWMAVVGAATLVLTGWIAPQLWQHDELEDHVARTHGGGLAGDEGVICCSDVPDHINKKKRVKEYLKIDSAHEEHGREQRLYKSCVACQNGEPVTATTGAGPQPVVPSVAAAATSVPVVAQDDPAPPTGGGSTGSATASPKPSAAPSVTPTPAKPPIAKLPVPRATTGARGPMPARTVAGVGPVVGVDPLAWVLALAIAATVVQLVLRPLRRGLVLRHLLKPLWPETVDQRVSNLWQMMLVGLRDAGWQTVPGEQPHELARRVGLEGMKVCATVLERARHGVRVDADDLRAMESAVQSVYAAARSRVGVAARAGAELRWPLV